MINILLSIFIINQFSPMPKIDPKLKWRTLESAHFAVHFSNQNSYETEEQLARQIIWYCEYVHAKLTKFMNWQPKSKTNVIISDFYDYVSGWATPFPNNTIFINLTFDRDMRVNYHDWLASLITHEYTHILNMDMAYGLAGFLRKIFGRIILPNTVMPLFMHEGFTVYNETKFAHFARSQSTYYQMMMRSAILDNNFFSIDKCVTYNLAQFPSSETPYFYGSQFYEYLALKYGDKKLSQYANWLSGGLPLFHNAQAKRVFGRNLYALWQDFRIDAQNRYTEQLNQITNQAITKTKPITQQGFYTQSPVFSWDNNKIYYLSKTNSDYSSLQEYDLINQKHKILLKKNISSPIRLSPDGSKLIFSIRDYYQNFYYFDDIYLFDLKAHDLQRVSNGLRATDADLSPDHSQIVFIQNQEEQTNICLLNLATNEIRNLTNNEELTQYAQPQFSPDGSKIAFAEWKKGGYQDIYIYDLNTDWIIPITQDHYLDLEPCWFKNGQYLLFSSDRTGIFNIFAYHLLTQKLYQITNVLTGAFAPALSSDHKQLVFQLYSSKGFDIHLTDFEIDTTMYVDITNDSVLILTQSDYTLKDTIYSELYYYNPFPSMYPKFWLPSVLYDNFDKWSYGFITYGADALFQHQYQLQALYNQQTNLPKIYFNYILDRFYPTILFDANYDRRRIQTNISTQFSFHKNTYQQYLTTSYLFDKYHKFYDHGLSLIYQFNNTKYFPYSISLEQGRYLGIFGELFDKRLFSYHNKASASLVVAEFINLPMKNHIVMLNANIGFTWGNYFYTIGGPKASFTIRGNTQRYSEHNGISLITEYRFPIYWIERGIGTMPLFFQNIAGKVFFDIGTGYNQFTDLKNPTILKGAGLELSLQTLCFYQIPIQFTCGVASDLKQAQITQIYFELNSIIPLFENYPGIKNPKPNL